MKISPLIIAIEVSNETGLACKEGFVSITKLENVEDRLKHFRTTVDNGAYTKWRSSERIQFVTDALERGNRVEFTLHTPSFS